MASVPESMFGALMSMNIAISPYPLRDEFPAPPSFLDEQEGNILFRLFSNPPKMRKKEKSFAVMMDGKCLMDMPTFSLIKSTLIDRSNININENGRGEIKWVEPTVI